MSILHHYPDHTYSYPNDDTKVENDHKEKKLQYLQQLTGQTKVATRDDYEDEALYTEMTRTYYVIILLFTSLHNYFNLIESWLFKYTIQRNSKKQIGTVRPVGKRTLWKVKMYNNYYTHYTWYTYFRVMKGIARELITGESETLVAVKMLKGVVY